MFKRLFSKFKYNKKTQIEFFVSSMIQEYEKQTDEKCEAKLSDGSRLIINGFELNIATTFELYEQEDKNKRPQFIKMLIKNVFARDKIKDFEQVKNKILPIVKPIAYHEIMQLQIDIDHKFENNDHNMPYIEVGSDLCVVFYEIVENYDDLGNKHTVLKGITNHELKNWNCKIELINNVGLKNIRKYTPCFHELTTGVWVSQDKDDQFSSLLHIKQIKDLPNLKGGPVALLAHKDYFVIASSDDINGLKIAFEFVNDCMNDERSVSPQAFVLKENKWEVFCPKSHELYKELRERLIINEQKEYEILQDLIEEKLKILGEDKSIVASFNFNTDETFSCWIQGYDLTIMPIVSTIVLDVFNDNEEDAIFKTACINTAKLWEICEKRFNKCLWSTKYVVLEGFPSKDELKKLGVKI